MESTLDICNGCAIMMESMLSMSTRIKKKRKETSVKNRLEELRKQRGVLQETLANELEVSRQTIGSIENGRYNPSIMLAFKLARYFQCAIEEIFIYEEDEKAE